MASNKSSLEGASSSAAVEEESQNICNESGEKEMDEKEATERANALLMDIDDDDNDEDEKSLSLDVLRAKVDSLEFAFLKPICAEVLQNPSVKTLKTFEAALNEVGKIPVHLSEFVAFPFAIHLKVIKTYKDDLRIQIFQSLGKFLNQAELCTSFDIFVNIFQKLHVSLSHPTNVTSVNKQLSEEEMEAIVTCIKNISVGSLPFHMNTLCQPEKIQIFGHSIFILLQLVAPDVAKSIRLKALQILEHLLTICDGDEVRSKVMYKFLPGIVSSVRKVSIPSAGNSSKAIVIKSLSVLGITVRVSTEFESASNLEQADKMLRQIVELLSKDYVLNSDVDYRKAFFVFCCEIATRNMQLPQCCQIISSILLRMKEDDESTISTGCLETLENRGLLQKLSFPDLENLIKSATGSMNSGNDVACVLALREISSNLSTMKLSFIEFQSFLPLLFQFIHEMIWKYRSVTVEHGKRSDPVYIASCRVCENLVQTTDLDEVVFEFMSTLSDLPNNFNTVLNITGIIVVFNTILPVLHETDPNKISDFEASKLAEVYISLLDMQSTEVACQSLETDIPAVQSAADIRRFYLLEGLGIFGQIYPVVVIPIVLYPLVEHAGTNLFNCDLVVNEVAQTSLKRLARPNSFEDFLKDNITLILNEISVRMLNLLLYPNCPHALIFLARYFDFSNDSFSHLVNQIFERCSDEFGGGSVQHIYVKVFYALINSIFIHDKKTSCENTKAGQKITLLQKMIAYQKTVGVIPPSEEDDSEQESEQNMNKNDTVEDCPMEESSDETISSTMQLVERVCHRLLNFLPNQNRDVRLAAMDSLIFGVQLLTNHENSLLPLAHSIWQNLVPRMIEKDYVVVRKSFELLQTLCTSCGTFLRKRTMEEAFPKFSLLLLNLAKEGEQVKDKNRQYYTCTQAYKLQLTILQGLSALLHSIEVDEFELDKIVSGCILYLKPNQHKNLREAAMKLLGSISSGKYCRTVWMKLIACGYLKAPQTLLDPPFTPWPVSADTESPS